MLGNYYIRYIQTPFFLFFFLEKTKVNIKKLTFHTFVESMFRESLTHGFFIAERARGLQEQPCLLTDVHDGLFAGEDKVLLVIFCLL